MIPSLMEGGKKKKEGRGGRMRKRKFITWRVLRETLFIPSVYTKDKQEGGVGWEEGGRVKVGTVLFGVLIDSERSQ